MTLLQMSISGTLLIAVIALLRLALLRAVPKRTFVLLWTLALVRLLVPFAPLLTVPVPEAVSAPVLPIETGQATAPSPDFDRASPEAFRETDPQSSTPTGVLSEGIQPTSEDSPTNTPRAALPSWHLIRRIVSAVCGAAIITMYAIGYRRFRKAEPVTHEASAAWLDAHPLRRRLAIRSLPGLDSPLTYGVLRPVILVPAGMNWTGDAARYALEHEYVHARRFDAAFKPLLAAALAVHWFNPAVWLMFSLANRDAELACDEAVLTRFGERERGAYARALLTMEERRGSPLYAGFGANTTKERIISIMKFKKTSLLSLVLAAAMVLSLAACAASGPKTAATAAESADIGDLALRPEGEANHIYKNGDYSLLVPLEYDELVTVDTPQDSESGVLFSVSEKASVDAAAAEGHDDWGAGWLFSVARISEDELHEKLCYDMSGAYVFARDSAEQYFMIYHPTDVRFFRPGDDYQNDQDGWADWAALNEWANTAAETFLAENADLEAFTRGNSELDMYLARAAYQEGAQYTLSTTAYGPMDGSGVDAAPYAERLMTGVDVSYESVGASETPDGEYVVLSFPEEQMRFDFFVGEGGNYVREVWYDGRENLMKAVYADGTTTASGIAQEWYDALAAAHGLT